MPLKIITLNTWGGRLLENIITFINAEQPDICTFQEVFNGLGDDLAPNLRSLKILNEKLGMPYSVFSATHRENNIERGNAVFSKYPLTLVDTIFFDVPYNENYKDIPPNFEYAPRNMQCVQVAVAGKMLNIFNIHGIWGQDGRDNERRLFMGRTIINIIKGRDNVILAGDFNVNPDTETIAGIERYVRSVFKNEVTSTFNMRHKSNPGYSTAVVDMIFISQGLQVSRHYSPQIDVSDHLPLVAVLNI